MWFDVRSMSLKHQLWSAMVYRPTPQEQQFLSTTMLESVPAYLGRYIRSLQFGLLQGSCNISITPTTPQKGIGCRTIGTVLHQLAVLCGGVEQLPTCLYVQAGESPFQIRSLLTLSYLCSAERRRSIYDNYLHVHIPAKSQETAQEYERRVVNAVHSQFSNYERIDGSRLKLREVRSTPDGLFLSPSKNELVIVEAKKSKRDFADGTAQIVQYYAQARNHSEFGDLSIKTILITASEQATGAYNVWQELMTCTKELKIVVNAFNTKVIAA